METGAAGADSWQAAASRQRLQELYRVENSWEKHHPTCIGDKWLAAIKRPSLETVTRN
jgi:hypothetical protein